MAYFKTDDHAVLEAHHALHADLQVLRDEAVAFGSRFGGRGVTARSASDFHFAGVIFDAPKPTDIWTTRDEHGRQRPRGALKKVVSAERREEWKLLKAEWYDNEPKRRASLDALYVALGTDWGNVLFCGIGMFEYAGALYVKTAAKLGAFVTEILGSEYDAASAAELAARPANVEA